MHYYCTYFDKNYLMRGLALLESLEAHETDDFTLYVVCMDEVTRVLLETLSLAHVILIPFHQVEGADAELLSTKSERSLVEYYWTATPSIVLHLIEHEPTIDVLTYLDADLFFFSAPAPIFQELGAKSVLLHEHRFSSSLKHLEQHNGKYNVGLMCFRRDAHGLAALRWWRARCLEWCFSRYEDGKLGDQMYLNDWPTRFPYVVELQHIGGGVGPWNHAQYRVALSSDRRIAVNDRPVIFYHFHSLQFASPDLIVPVEHTHYPMTHSVLRHLYLPYVEALIRGKSRVQAVSPTFECGLHVDVQLTPDHVLFARKELEDAVRQKGVPQLPREMNAEWICFCPPSMGDDTSAVADHTLQRSSTLGQTDSAIVNGGANGTTASTVSASGTFADHYRLFTTIANHPFAKEIEALYVIGAHVFQEHALVTKMLPNLRRIYLFEPIQQCYEYLKTLEQCDARIRAFPYAIARENGRQQFFLTDNQGESSSLLPLGKHRTVFPDVHHVHTTMVETRSLEHVVDEYRLALPDMLFLDVQGAEYQILSSLSARVCEQIKLIYAEASLEELYQGSKTLADMRALLEDRFELNEYVPMSPDVPTHGNVLFVKKQPVVTSKGTTAMSSCAQEPLISVIVSTYNSLEFMRECLQNLVAQTLMDRMEIIVIDAASQQYERTVVEEFQEQYPNIAYIRTARRVTVYAAWNLAIRAAKGTYITPFSTNDSLRRDAYEILVRALEHHPDSVLVYGDTYLTNKPHETFEHHTRFGEWRWPEYSFEDLLQYCRVGPHPMWRKSVHEEMGYFDESYEALGDQEFWLRLGERYPLTHINEVTGLYWVSPEGLSNQTDIADPEQVRIRKKYQERYGLRQAPAHVPTCSIIIPVFNKCELTEQCLRRVAEVTLDVPYEVILVDNASTDGTASLCDSLSGDVQVIRNQENLGFAKACNQGAAAAKGEFIVFLNNDTLPRPGWLQAMVDEVRQHPDVAIVGSKLLYEDETIQHAGVVFSKSWETPYHLYKLLSSEHSAVNVRRELQAVTAACMLIRREVFESVAGFDEGYRNGFEDVDLCLKVRHLGRKVVYQPKSVLIHLESQTAGRKRFDSSNAQRLLDTWRDRLCPDEDLIVYEDRLFIQTVQVNGVDEQRLTKFAESEGQVAWKCLVDAERALQQLVYAVSREQREQYEHALQHVLSRTPEWPSDVGALRWAMNLCKKRRYHEAGLAFAQRVLALSDDPTAHELVAREAIVRGDFGAAEHHADAMLRSQHVHEQAYTLKGVIAIQRADYRGALAHFQAVLNINERDQKALMGTGMCCMGLQDVNAAWDAFSHALTHYPDDVEAANWLLQAGTALQRWEELTEHLTRFVERNPANSDVRYALAGVQVRCGKVAEARSHLNTLRLLSPDLQGLDDLASAIATTADAGGNVIGVS